ncbi:MAG: hypothetical protein DRI65_15045 [Chloroflexota bacterium]|nr:MAG: hypothetical protein DRI65_15045 [Chloroflexota bacterium]
MINYIEKGYRQHGHIESQGHWLVQQDGVWTSDDDAVVQPLMDAYDPLPDAKYDAIQRVNLHATGLIADVYGFINEDNPQEAKGLVDFITDIYGLIVPAAREDITGRLLETKTVNDNRQAKVIEVNALTTWQECDAYDATVGW